MPTTSRNRSASKTAQRKTQIQEKPATAAAPPVNGDGPSPSSSEVLRRLYFSLLRCRMALEHGRRLAPAGEYDFGTGEESVSVGTTFSLRAEDTVAASGSDLPGQIAKGTSLPCLMARLRGDDCGCAAASSASIADDPFNFGTGMALVHKLEKKRNIAIAFCAEPGAAIDRWHDAMKVAEALNLPVVYVIKSGAAGLPAMPAKKRGGHLKAFSYMTRDYGFPGIVVEGHDAVAVWRVAQECIHRARNGGGPSLIECTTESRQDPLVHMEHYLRKRSLWDDNWRRQIGAEVEGVIKAS